MFRVVFDTYSDGNPYRRDVVLMDWPTLIHETNKEFDGLSGTVVISHDRVVRCTYCGQWESILTDCCGSCGQHM